MEWVVLWNDEVHRFFDEDQAYELYNRKQEIAGDSDLLKIYKEVENEPITREAKQS